MALPTKNIIQNMDFYYRGAPFVEVPTKSVIDTQRLDVTFRGAPFVRNPADAPPPPTQTYDGRFFAFF